MDANGLSELLEKWGVGVNHPKKGGTGGKAPPLRINVGGDMF